MIGEMPPCRTCTICGGALVTQLRFGGDFSLVKCTACETVSTWPQIGRQALQEMYRSGYQESLGWPFPLQIKRQSDVLNLIERVVSSGSLLDVGCGAGWFMADARKRGWTTTGLEPNLALVEYGRVVLGLNIVMGSTDQIPQEIETSQFDVVYLSHVLEHIPDPLRVLMALHKLVKPSGIVVIRVPNIDALLFKLLRQHWVELYPEVHLFHFSSVTLRRLLESADCKIIHLQTRLCDFAYEPYQIVKGLLSMLRVYHKLPTKVRAAYKQAGCPEYADFPNSRWFRYRKLARVLIYPVYLATYPIWKVSANLGMGYEIIAIACPTDSSR